MAIVRPPAQWGLSVLLERYSGLTLRPSRAGGIFVIGGELEFTAADSAGQFSVTDSFNIDLLVSPSFPKEPAAVRELGGRVPPGFHTYKDGNLCLGSPIRLRMLLRDRPSLTGFVENCVIPYFYNLVRYQREKTLPLGEL